MPRQLRAHMMLQPAAHNRAQENLILSDRRAPGFLELHQQQAIRLRAAHGPVQMTDVYRGGAQNLKRRVLNSLHQYGPISARLDSRRA